MLEFSIKYYMVLIKLLNMSPLTPKPLQDHQECTNCTRWWYYSWKDIIVSLIFFFFFFSSFLPYHISFVQGIIILHSNIICFHFKHLIVIFFSSDKHRPFLLYFFLGWSLSCDIQNTLLGQKRHNTSFESVLLEMLFER